MVCMLVFTFSCTQAAASLLRPCLKFIDFSSGRANRKGMGKGFFLPLKWKRKKTLPWVQYLPKQGSPCMILVHCSPIKVIMSHIVYKACFLLSIHFAHVDVWNSPWFQLEGKWTQWPGDRCFQSDSFLKWMTTLGTILAIKWDNVNKVQWYC